MPSPKNAVAPFLRWAGSKRKLLSRLAPYWGNKHTRYIEPFMGSAAFFYAINPSSAILSDINEDLVRTFVSVRDHPRAVYNRLLDIPRGKRSYNRVRKQSPTGLDPLDRAARFIFLNRFCFNGIYRTNAKGVFNVPYASLKQVIPPWDAFRAAAQPLKSAIIICADFEEVVSNNVREGDFVYLDPLYAVRNRRVFRQYDPQTFGLDDLNRMDQTLRLIDKRNAKFVLSYAYAPESIEYFQNWQRRKAFTQRNVSGFAEHRRMAAELIVTNI